MKFTKLCWKNLFSYGDYYSEIQLDQDGIIFVRGSNKDGDSSNGSGKSAIPNIFVWTLYGKPLKNIPLDNVRCSFTGAPAHGQVEFWKGEHYYEVSRYRGDPEHGNGILVKRNGQPLDITNGTTRDAQHAIDEIIGLDYYAFVSSVIFSSETPFTIPTMSAEKRRVHLESILGLQAYSEYGKIAKIKARNVKRILEDLSISEREKNTFLAHEKNEVRNYAVKLESFNSDKVAALVLLSDKLSDITAIITSIDVSKINTLEADILSVTEYIENSIQNQKAIIRSDSDLATANANTVKNKISVSISKYNSKVESISKEADKLGAKLEKNLKLLLSSCPTCSRGWTGVEVDEHRSKFIEDEVVAKESMREELKILTDVHAKDIAILQSSLSKEDAQAGILLTSLSTILTNERQAKGKLVALQAELKGLPSARERSLLLEKMNSITNLIDAKKSESNPYRDIIDNITVKIQDLEEQLELMNSKKADLEEQLKYTSFWDESFNSDGLKMFIFESIVPILNSRIDLYLPLMFNDKRMKVTFDKMMNMTIISNGSSTSYGNLSMGERKRVDLSIALAMLDTAQAQYGSISNVMFFDEIFDGSLDSQGVKTVSEILHSMPVSTIFVISHRTEIASGFDNILDVEKNGKQSRILA